LFDGVRYTSGMLSRQLLSEGKVGVAGSAVTATRLPHAVNTALAYMIYLSRDDTYIAYLKRIVFVFTCSVTAKIEESN